MSSSSQFYARIKDHIEKKEEGKSKQLFKLPKADKEWVSYHDK